MLGRGGQSTVEYGVLIAILAAALLAMQGYVKRGMAGRLRAAADAVGEPYAPKDTTSDFQLAVSSQTLIESKLVKDQQIDPGTKADVVVTTTTISNDTTTRSGRETVGPLGTDLFD